MRGKNIVFLDKMSGKGETKESEGMYFMVRELFLTQPKVGRELREKIFRLWYQCNGCKAEIERGERQRERERKRKKERRRQTEMA